MTQSERFANLPARWKAAIIAAFAAVAVAVVESGAWDWFEEVTAR